MWIRRAFFAWLFPAAFVLPLWLFVGWGVFNAGAWAFLWVLFIAIPSVFVGNLVLAFLVRARPTVRAERAVSWLDLAVFGVWHLLTIALGFYGRDWWGLLFVVTVLVGIGAFWSTVTQLWREARPTGPVRYAATGAAYIPPRRPRQGADRVDPDVIVLTERPRTEE